MKKLFTTLFILLIVVTTAAQIFPSVKLAWNHSTDSDVVDYTIYYGLNSGKYTMTVNTGYTNFFCITNLSYGWNKIYYFTVTARDSLGLESEFSNEVSYTPTNNISPPTIFITGMKGS